MSIPKPPIDLKDHCSAVWNNTVYVYTPAGFQSLPLTEGAEWERLPSGVSVTGGACVQAGNVALYIVGGSANTSTTDYTGLQRYTFADQSWETITPVVPVTKDRRNHGAAYISSSTSILVYAGSQNAGDTGPSTQTFLISVAPPYAVLSFNSQGAPPLVAPMIMPWDESHVIMIGGSTDNKQIYTFGQPEGWQTLGTTLADAIQDPTTTQCSIVTGDDGSKVLEKYNLGVTPNDVTRYALWANGKPAPVGQLVGAPSSKKRRRDLTVSNWPAYNSTLAPTSKRSDYSIAESADGLVVITGGDSSDPVAIFDQRENTWVNVTSLLVAKNQIPLTSTTSTSLPSLSTVQPTSSATAASTPVPTSNGVAGTGQPKSRILTVLGATLGTIFGIAAILILILVLLRWKREKKKNVDHEVNEKENRLSFADQGAEFMHEAGGSRGRAYSESVNSSVTSLQIFHNKGAKSASKGHRRGMASDSSQMGLVKAKSPLGINDPMEMAQMSERSSPTFTPRTLDPKAHNSPPHANPAPIAFAGTAMGATTVAGAATKGATEVEETERSRSNGWSRYFANNEVTNLASMPSGRSTYGTNADTFRSSEISRSEYGDSTNMSNSSVRPLELNLGPKFESQRLSRVATGSPTMGRSSEYLREGMAAEIRRAGSTSSQGSDPGYAYSSTNTQGGTSTWTPMSNSGWSDARKPGDRRSISSSNSTNNPYYGGGANPYHTNDPTAGYFSKGNKAEPPLTLPVLNLGKPNFGDVSRDSQASAVTVFPSGISGSPTATAFPRKIQAAYVQQPPNDFDFPMPNAYFGGQQRDSSASALSNVTVFPRGVPSPTVSSFPKPKLVDARSPPMPPVPSIPPSPARRGPIIRKTTGDEDMSWLNINAGRAV